MKDNKGGIVDFPLRYIKDQELEDSLQLLHAQCNGVVTREELFKGAQLAKGILGLLEYQNLSMGVHLLMPFSRAFAGCRV